MGGYLVQGRTVEEGLSLVAAARDLEAAGCFSLVLEGVPAEVAGRITAAVSIPTIGIGAGVDCDGQVLVIHDLLGITPPPRPRFVAAYAELGEAAVTAARSWADAVRARQYPGDRHSYFLSQAEAGRWQRLPAVERPAGEES